MQESSKEPAVSILTKALISVIMETMETGIVSMVSYEKRRNQV